ncbi:hypothetical protein NI17_020085 [Thermobifida halotolerans]|uniref:Uncharacterized protein n=1 Tax=Thermobifida halotolerans TaxID=483545 RepID=A0AA97M3B9_9ACTN|nr:hypothetical protein [Thermobifida halotolerans]UOE19034.1 hypothetical protein NI17_020085 [Thermobifida halotolerans]
MKSTLFSTSSQARTDDLVTAAAWVETPLQLLSVLEAHHIGGFARHTRVLPRAGSTALVDTVAALTRIGLPDGLTVLPPEPTPSLYRTNADIWFVGDAFSGQVQRALLSGRTRDYVIVDDGLATIHLLRLLTRRTATPLERARVRSSPPRRALGLAAAVKLRAAARAGRLTVFTVLPLPDQLLRDAAAVGIRVVGHDFPWLRSLPGGSAPDEDRVVLGSAMVRDGLLHAEPYLAWVAGQAREEPVVYYPHRREDARTLEPLNADPRVRVVPQGLPAELALRGLGERHRVVSLPSTAVTSLRVLLGRHGVTVEAVPVPETWWTDQASPGLRAHLSTFVADQKDTP